MSPLARSASAIAEARLTHKRLGELPPAQRPDTPHEGYVIQDAVHAGIKAGFGPLVGWKIGCTTAVMQRMLAIPSPCYGGILAAGVHRGSARLRHADFCRPGIECEIAVRLGADLDASGAPYSGKTVARHVASCMPAIELVDDRYIDYRTIGVATLIADDFFHAGCVLGPETADWRSLDLPNLAGRTIIGGQERGRGRGGDVMGHPLNAVAWLANAQIARGQCLRADQVVLSGSVVETQWVAPGDDCVVEIGALGSVGARFD